MRRRPYRIEDVARVYDEVNISLQDGVYSPRVRLLYVYLSLVAPRLRTEPRVPRVSQVCVRDVRDPYDLSPFFGLPYFIGSV